MCVIFVYTECTAVLISLWYAWVGGCINAARCLSVSVYTARSSVEYAANRSFGEWSALSTSLIISTTYISTGISIATSLYYVHTSKSTYHVYAFIIIRFLPAVPFIRTFIPVYLLQVFIVVVVYTGISVLCIILARLCPTTVVVRCSSYILRWCKYGIWCCSWCCCCAARAAATYCS